MSEFEHSGPMGRFAIFSEKHGDMYRNMKMIYFKEATICHGITQKKKRLY